MADISQIEINNTTYDICDAVARDNYLPLAGGVMTGAITHKGANFDLTDSHNGFETDGYFNPAYFRFLDKEELTAGMIQWRANYSGNVWAQFDARNKTSGNTDVINSLRLNVEKDGTRTVTVSDPVVWRDALGASSGVWPASSGGTGESTLQNSANALINALGTGNVNITDEDTYIITQHTTISNTTYYRRPIKYIWPYFRTQADTLYPRITGGNVTLLNSSNDLNNILDVGSYAVSSGTSVPDNAPVDNFCGRVIVMIPHLVSSTSTTKGQQAISYSSGRSWYRKFENGAWGPWYAGANRTTPSSSGNRVLATPNGAAGYAEFRSLTSNDLPSTILLQGGQINLRSTSIDRDGTFPDAIQSACYRYNQDKDGDVIGYSRSSRHTTGAISYVTAVQNVDTNNNTVINQFLMYARKDGTIGYEVSDRTVFAQDLRLVSYTNANLHPYIGILTSGAQHMGICGTVANSNNQLLGRKVGLNLSNLSLSLYDYDAKGTIYSYVSDAADSQVYTTTISNIITAPTGSNITITAANFLKRNGVIHVNISASGFVAETGAQTVGTLAYGRRPNFYAYGNGSSARIVYCRISSDGALSAYFDPAPTTTGTYTFSFVYPVRPSYTIYAHPSNVTLTIGDDLEFYCGCTDNNATYQWQFQAAGSSTWSNSTLTGYNTNHLGPVKSTTTNAQNGRKYRCVITCSDNTVLNTNAATVTSNS